MIQQKLPSMSRCRCYFFFPPFFLEWKQICSGRYTLHRQNSGCLRKWERLCYYFLIQYLHDCCKLLITFLSSDKVDSYRFWKDIHCFCRGMDSWNSLCYYFCCHHCSDSIFFIILFVKYMNNYNSIEYLHVRNIGKYIHMLYKPKVTLLS